MFNSTGGTPSFAELGSSLPQKAPSKGDSATWTDDRVELLKRLWQDGLSASQIAGELGGITRNAVIGKVHRLGLSGRFKTPNQTPRPRKPRASPQMFRPKRPMSRGNIALATEPARNYNVVPEPEYVENIIPLGQRCSLLELDKEKCHWPVGDPGHADFYFCGGKTAKGMPYCGYHGRVSYQPPASRGHHRQYKD